MGLTNSSIGIHAVDSGLIIEKTSPQDRVIALAGNPNVGKSTVFNSLTGMHQHTGNWPGKTVATAQGICKDGGNTYVLVDIPGTYSLMPHSAEEEVARDLLCSGEPDAVVVVCDATCLERNLNLVLQTIELCPQTVVCVNLMDEAARKHIRLDLGKIEKRLGVPVVSTIARKKRSLQALLKAVTAVVEKKRVTTPYAVSYPAEIEDAIARLSPFLPSSLVLNPRWVCLQILQGNPSFSNDEVLTRETQAILSDLAEKGMDSDKIKDAIVSALVQAAEKICQGAITYEKDTYNKFDRQLDKLLTGRFTAYPIMLFFLAFIFWLTITGANYPSALLSALFNQLQTYLTAFCLQINMPDWLYGALILGVYRVLASVVSVMLPPMAIFFPLFTLLEDAGYLPRIAYNLDKPFKRCCACGKQALTMCMGFGCNAAGVVGCRIIDSPRERLLAILTNSFVPCNGRFPTLILLITMFFVSAEAGLFPSLLSAALLTFFILLSILLTFAATKILTKTVLKGVPSSFTLELPPYRRPQLGRVIVRSVLDRTLFVLGRAVAIAAPAGLVIWLLANVSVHGTSILSHCAAFFDPFARLMGLDGVILLAFILGFPANEIVMPLILMTYMATGSLPEVSDTNALHTVLVQNGWTWQTAASMLLFTLVHWPCSTTMLTIKKETGSAKWTAIAVALPTICGILLCILFNVFISCIR
ncbi:MAG: ferrous iron transport protein B [Clostridia bacterium]|nr:ferrous iron transport protein B [Clostridia bacterium]